MTYEHTHRITWHGWREWYDELRITRMGGHANLRHLAEWHIDHVLLAEEPSRNYRVHTPYVDSIAGQVPRVDSTQRQGDF